ncbi:MAG: tetratricopeptide repeat protein [Candidatus Riflebacteria bacterium]|nr:tetratricopeptide repeat protein [Candidatus Riflebacteria bacterium]
MKLMFSNMSGKILPTFLAFCCLFSPFSISKANAQEFNNTNVLVEAAVNHIYQKRYNQALELLLRAYEKSPQHTGVNYNLGRLYELSGNFQEAIRFYQTVVAIDPTMIASSRGIARCSVELKRLKVIEQSRVIENAQEEIEERRVERRVEERQQIPEAYYSAPSETQPQTPSGYSYQTEINRSRGSMLEPTNPEVNQIAAEPSAKDRNEGKIETKLENGDYSGALKMLDVMIENRPDSANLHYYYGKAFSMKGDLFAAIKHLEESLKADKNFFESYYLLAQNYARVNLLDDAVGNYLKYYAVKPHPKVAIEIAKVYEKMGKQNLAREYYSKANAMNPGNPNIQKSITGVDSDIAVNDYLAANYEFSRGEYKKAIELYQSSLRFKENLNSTYRNDAERKLEIARLRQMELDRTNAPQTSGFNTTRRIYATVNLKYSQLANVEFKTRFTGPVTVEWRGHISKVFQRYGRDFVLMIKELDREEQEEMRHEQSDFNLNPNLTNQPLFLLTTAKGSLPPFIREGKMITFTGETDWKFYDIINDYGQTVRLPAFDLISAHQ